MALVIFFLVLLFSAHALSPAAKMLKSQAEERKKLLNMYSELETHVNAQIGEAIMMIDKHSGEGMNTSAEAKFPENTKEFEATAADHLERMENVQVILEALIPIIIISEAVRSEKQAAKVQFAQVLVTLNSSAHISCKSNGQPVSICIWKRLADGHQVVTTIDDKRHGDGTPAQSSFCFGGGLNADKCCFKVESVTEKDVGQWSCTLVTNDGLVLTGKVNITKDETELKIYFATKGEGIKAYSRRTLEVSTIVNSTEALYGIAYDAIRSNLYWTSKSKLHRSNADGTAIEILLSTRKYGTLRGLGLDFITGNVYVVSDGGYILVCNGKTSRKFRCVPILSGQGVIRSIAINPTEGTMYWTSKVGSIQKANMDGYDSKKLIQGLNDPFGITIYHPGARLYWADYSSKQILQSSVQGGEIATVAKLHSGPFGIVLAGQRLYWGLASSKLLQSSTEEGCDTRTVHNRTAVTWQLAVPVLSLAAPTNRRNPCEGETCAGVCVLTPTSFRCA